jgi:alanyl-tRNA synthetase
MMKLSGREIRQRFIDFFATKHGHQHKPSASLIPVNPTVLLTPAGMLPFVPIFLGVEPPPNPPRVVTSQKCARISGKASDLAYVGRTPRHHTFFEMLGNFSFGDYFKVEAITWAWDFVAKELGIEPERLWVSVYYKDQESRDIWRDKVGLSNDRIIDRDEKDNFWGPPGETGPCGPCTEIYVDMSPTPHKTLPPEGLDDDCFVEIWNLVLMEQFKDGQGDFSPLQRKNIDTGMGLERIAMVMQGVPNTFETDLFLPILKRLAEMTGVPYKKDPETDVALKIVTDHMRCVTFAVADGIVPSNEGRGYIIRMVLRRAVRYGRALGINEPMLFKLVSTIRDTYQEAYPELQKQYDLVVDTIKAEEQRFLDTLERGSRMLDELIQATKASKKSMLSGDDVFKLYDTYGFPVELTEEMAAEKGMTVDQPGFELAMKAQKDQARQAQGKKRIVDDQLYSQLLQEVGSTEFKGYEGTEATGKIVAIIHEGQRQPEFGGTNQPFEIVLDATPFYPESGGQVGDRGIMYVPSGQQSQTVVVMDTQKVGDLIVHHCLFDQGGSIAVGTTVQAEVNPESRANSAAHHSATHLVHAALRQVLGDRVTQAGSRVAPDGARFDFTFHRAVTADEIRHVEQVVNQWIFSNTDRQTVVTDIESAKQQGALANFDEKYGDQVRVVAFGSHSKELCGGTHVDRLGDIGVFKITSEGAIASGVRRIEFVVGSLALQAFMASQVMVEQASQLLKVPPAEMTQRIERVLDEKKQLEKQLKALQERSLLEQVKQWPSEFTMTPVSLVVKSMNVDEADLLKFAAESAMRLFTEAVIILGASIAGKAHFVVVVPKSITASHGLKAGEIVKQLATHCGGGGGGSPQMAQAGGKHGERVEEALSVAKEQLTSQFATSPVSS